MSEHKYKITYDVFAPHEPITGDEIPDGRGACDSIILHSILHPDDGSYGHALISLDGRTGFDLTPAELWRAWIMMAKHLADSDTLSEGKRDLCARVFEAVSSVMHE